MTVAFSNLCCATTYLSQHIWGCSYSSPRTLNCPQKFGGDNKTPENITPTEHKVINPEQKEGLIAQRAQI